MLKLAFRLIWLIENCVSGVLVIEDPFKEVVIVFDTVLWVNILCFFEQKHKRNRQLTQLSSGVNVVPWFHVHQCKRNQELTQLFLCQHYTMISVILRAETRKTFCFSGSLRLPNVQRSICSNKFGSCVFGRLALPFADIVPQYCYFVLYLFICKKSYCSAPFVLEHVADYFYGSERDGGPSALSLYNQETFPLSLLDQNSNQPQ
jgi:hypothetical protein